VLLLAENRGHNASFDRADMYQAALQKLLEMQ
jgi:hypothetical protein